MAERIRVLGAPEVRRSGAWRPLPLDLRTALLGALIVADAPVPRDRAAALFWPDAPDRKARQNLRQLVHRARPLVGADALVLGPGTLMVRLPSDLAAARTALAAGPPAAAAPHLRGLARSRLLDGLDRIHNPEWQAWLALERRALEEEVRRSLIAAARVWSAAGPPPAGIEALAAWCDRDPFDEEVLLAYLAVAACLPHERAAATARLDGIRRLYRDELGAEPAPAVAAAAAALRRGAREDRAGPAASPPAVSPPVATPRHRTIDLPLVGRTAELEDLDRAVADPDVGVVVVHGLGGVGKTRLVRAWAEARRGAADPTPVVRLAGAEGPAEGLRRVAATIGWRVDDHLDAATLRTILAGVAPTLVLDEVEGLEWFAPWVVELVADGDGPSVVVTSRELVDVPNALVLRLHGLPWTAPAETAPPALVLFLQAARRIRPDLHLDARDRAAVVAFAERVAGLPLALVVAAGWLQLGPAADVLHSLPDGGELAVDDLLAPSWARLTPQQRTALEALSVFSGRFPPEAAASVAGADRRTVRALVDAALVEPGTSRGLALHPVVRADAARRLAARDGAPERARAAHARYVAGRLGPRGRALYGGPEQLEVLAEVSEGIGDLRLAWAHLCATGDLPALDGMLDLVWAMELRGWYALGEELTDAAVAAAERELERLRAEEARTGRPDLPVAAAARVLARALARRGIFAMRRADARTTRGTARRAEALFESTRSPIDPFVHFHLGIAATLDGDLDEAEAWHARLVREARRRGDTWAAYGARANLATIARTRGDLAAAIAGLEALAEERIHRQDAWADALLGINLASALLEAGGREREAAVHAERAADAAVALGSRTLELVGRAYGTAAAEAAGEHERAAAGRARVHALFAGGAFDDVAADRMHARVVLEVLEVPPEARPVPAAGVTPVSRPPS